MIRIPSRPRYLPLLLALLLTAIALPAWACGGCFSPPIPGDPTIKPTVVQDAERVLFVRDEATKTSHVWIEVRYTGLAKDFGWVLPVPKVPKVGVGSVLLFNFLDDLLHARYALVGSGSENCANPLQGCEPPVTPDVMYQDSAMASDSAGGGGGPGGPSSVQILASGTTGPYDYVVVTGGDVEVLYTWLTSRGYGLLEKAKPILQSHIAKGDVFVAIKLANGQGVQAIRPVVLQMPDAEPCVPLRLTSVAAAEELSVVVTVAGAGRAVVKNHLDVVVNPFKLALVEASAAGGAQGFYNNTQVPKNYDQVASAAIDEAGGRAFVTEAALPTNNFYPGGPLEPNWTTSVLKSLASATNWYEVATTELAPLKLGEEVAEALTVPGELTTTFAGTAPLQTLAELTTCGFFWNQWKLYSASIGKADPNLDCKLPNGKVYSKKDLQALPANGQAMASALQKSIVEPVQTTWKLIVSNSMMTRLMMRISPDEMDRDPVFAFNSSLPAVQPARQIKSTTVCPTGWLGAPYHVRMSVDGLGSWVFSGANAQDPRFASAPFALSMAVLDESGPAQLVAPAQASLVSTAIAGALPGKPSLPKDLVLEVAKPWLPPPSDPLVTTLGPWPKPAGCKALPGWVDGKLPPPKVVDPDAGGSGDTSIGIDVTLSDSADGEPTSGPVPGVDAAGGWADTGADSAPAVKAAAAADSGGCSAQAGQHSAWAPLFGLLTLAGLAMARRRPRHGKR